LKKLKVTNKEEILEMNRLLEVIFPDFPRKYLDEIINKKDTKDCDELKYDMRKFSDEDEFSITLKGDDDVIFSDSIDIVKTIQKKVINTYKDIYDSDITGLKEMVSSDYEFNRWIFYYPNLEKYDEQ